MAAPAQANHRLLWPYALPYALYVSLGLLAPEVVSIDVVYGLRIVLCAAALIAFRHRYARLRGPRSPAVSALVGGLAGLVGLALWVGLVLPFAPVSGEPWTEWGFVLRCVAAVAVVPILEELLMRGYALRLLLQWDRARQAGEAQPFAQAFDHSSIDDVAPGDWTALAILGSSILFAAGHLPHEWPAALAYGLLMAGLWVLRKDLLSCVVAHAVTNLGLALLVRGAGLWQLW